MKPYESKKFQITVNLLIGFICLLFFSPFVILLMSSIASENSLIQNGYSFFPSEFSLAAYTYMLTKADTIFRAYGITLIVTTLGTALSLIITPMLAYPLSRKDYKYRNIITFIIFFTMLFRGGLVPTYILYTQYFHIKNTISALIFPNLLINAFTVILFRNYITSTIPFDMIEAAKVDSANEYTIFSKIIMPLSLPMIATTGLLTGLAYWNDWMNSLYFVGNSKLYSLQAYLGRILQDIQFMKSQSDSSMTAAAQNMPGISIRMAIAVIGIIPVMTLYPFFQKYFVKGITMGAVKG